MALARCAIGVLVLCVLSVEVTCVVVDVPLWVYSHNVPLVLVFYCRAELVVVELGQSTCYPRIFEQAGLLVTSPSVAGKLVQSL